MILFMRMWLVLAILALAGCGSDLGTAPSPTSKKPSEGPKAEANSIRGRATIRLRGESWDQILRGMELVLVPASAKDEIIAVRDRTWRERAVDFDYSNGARNLDLVSIGLKAVSLKTDLVKTDAEGYYIFQKVKPGKYLIYGQYKSRYALGYWLVDVEVKDGQSTVVNLKNDNMKEVYNVISSH